MKHKAAESVQLKHYIPAEILFESELERIACASDASLYHLVPQAVVRPRTIEEIRQLISAARITKLPLTFRAAGTSLSGQAVTEGILVDISRGWKTASIENSGELLRAQPGIIGGRLNLMLRQHQRKIGPDPASLHACMLGGILANNASGMCCGVEHNAYHTLAGMKFLLADGTFVDTEVSDAEAKLHAESPAIAQGILALRDKVLANPALVAKIRAKYQIKNTCGYSLNSFLDYSTAAEILSHLMIGSEGTLGFIAEAVLRTVPDPAFKYTGLLLFKSVTEAAHIVPFLKDSGAAALEIMDRAALRSVERQKGIPREVSKLPPHAAALLVEYHDISSADHAATIEKIGSFSDSLATLLPVKFSDSLAEQAALWKIRKGMFPSVGAQKPSGATVIIEDVAFPIARLGSAVESLQSLFVKHDYINGIIFGHAKDGNLHFVITPTFANQRSITQYKNFMHELADIVIGKFNGSLKAEHGTGRNIAPFVEKEWGRDAYQIMQELKNILDPEMLLNPGVILNSDAECFIKQIKTLPPIDGIIDRCIECGFCEPVCPSRSLTLSPRQRIVVQREIARREDPTSLQAAFQYAGVDTCAADSLCAGSCPVQIDTGAFIRSLRNKRAGSFAQLLALLAADLFRICEYVLWNSLRLFEKVNSPGMRTRFNRVVHTIEKFFHTKLPKLHETMPFPAPQFALQNPINAEYLYFPSCISRIMSSDGGSLIATICELSEKANVQVKIGKSVGLCCGQPFHSKGYEDANCYIFEKTVRRLFKESDSGKLPIVLDTSPCSSSFKHPPAELSTEALELYHALTFLDPIEYIEKVLLPRLSFTQLQQKVVLHPVCSVQRADLSPAFEQVAKQICSHVEIPRSAGCCGFAGDRGLLVPELTAAALSEETVEVQAAGATYFCSTSIPCEVALTRATGKQYQSLFKLLSLAVNQGN